MFQFLLIIEITHNMGDLHKQPLLYNIAKYHFTTSHQSEIVGHLAAFP